MIVIWCMLLIFMEAFYKFDGDSMEAKRDGYSYWVLADSVSYDMLQELVRDWGMEGDETRALRRCIELAHVKHLESGEDIFARRLKGVLLIEAYLRGEEGVSREEALSAMEQLREV